MWVILSGILKRKVTNLIKFFGNDVDELIIDMKLSIGTCNSIELDIQSDTIFIHTFMHDDWDIMYEWNELSIDDQLEITKILKNNL